MKSSIDSISFVANIRRLPPKELLSEKNWIRMKGRLEGQYKWINNGMKEIYEPKLTFYQTFDNKWRLRADLSLPNLLNGDNIELLDDAELETAFEMLSNNLSDRSGISFDAGHANICRIDYAMNFLHDTMPKNLILEFYRRYSAPRMERVAYGDHSVYFQNKSRTIKLYDKAAEVAKKHRKDSSIIEKAGNIIRIEYSFPNATAVSRYAKRKGFADIRPITLCSRQAINIAIDEMEDILKLDHLEYDDDPLIVQIYKKTGNINQAQRLAGFRAAEAAFGKNFYLDQSLGASKTSYSRNRRECRKYGF